MSLRSWFRGSGTTTPKSSAGPSRATTPPSGVQGTVMTAEQQELADLSDAMQAMAHIMNDDPESAEAHLRQRKDPSSFHLLGLGVSIFMRSILGFEKDVMAEASKCIADCETRSWNDKVKGERREPATDGRLFPNGSEFAIVYAQALLMNAVVSVLHESLTDALKAFYKLRKAMAVMSSISAAEEKIMKEQGASSARGNPFEQASTASGSGNLAAEDEDSDLEFVDADEKVSPEAPIHVTYDGHTSTKDSTSQPATDAATLEGKLQALEIPDDSDTKSHLSKSAVESQVPSLSASRAPSPGPPPQLTDAASDGSLFTHPIDIFIHSAINMCYGSLMLVLSMVPPAFSRLLGIIGFRGDRDKGLHMLWQSAAHPNMNGAVAGLLLLGYYHGLLAFADVLPSERDVAELAEPDEIVGYPRGRCIELLRVMRERYPASGLWRMEQARVLIGEKKLKEGIEMLEKCGDAKMRQVTALSTFELAVSSICYLDWPRMHSSFVRMVELNDWSHALYYFIAGCAHLEMYRDAVHELGGLSELSEDGSESEKEVKAGDVKVTATKDRLDVEDIRKKELISNARKYKKSAETLFRKAPTTAGRKRFMARQMPFEVFVMRKVAKWEERATALKLDLADAIGPSPAAEMIYLWNGGKRMNLELIEKAMTILEWDRCTSSATVAKVKEEHDEVAIHGVGQAALLRHAGRGDEAKGILLDISAYDRATCKGGNKDDYILASATYELAMLAWDDVCRPERWPTDADEVEEFRRKKTEECYTLLETVAKWETYVLDARFGMRVQTGLDTVRWLSKKKGWTL
ncbi:mitochondrial outer membrane protein IML2 [Pyricularia oryzae 70-15]|uniref:Inclusion body clearance protein IML2 n=2 Tax=Pyricularia oryzae TaxID=318829 RepID=IML2_PYRO7|nr:mitochondrial outer membrane protein IML2 [Pyricularia oryzae 70-15]A4QTI0.1 RecName: Full=Inclusion body clearance protein IML2 [Pyricularia oryzae 70-15]EHA52771.1 mitochondrial outer membrane protein IML2 [Pyricularia oryzae 70-15]KAI7925116.1 mitochondrial outer membrane protein IML2 [Pyricularia oryzae]KAI7929023.1 mitochondrial outer membrane protein IML2 [Pyricularia oryzae]